MKLIIQIPCYNEEKTLPVTYADLPKQIPGIDTIETLIINDGSTDNTVAIAKQIGIDHIVNFPDNKGLAKAFMAGIDASLRLGADIIVNTDGDNQYQGNDIPKLITPILENKAEVVVGDRQTDTIQHFSPSKKKLQKIGSYIVRKASNTNINDTTSGFRAYSRDAAMKLNVLNNYSYTLETIINAGRQKTIFKNVPIKTNKKLRKSRLFKNNFDYINQSAATIIRSYIQLNSLTIFIAIAFVFFLISFALFVRYLFFFFQGAGAGHIQSLLLGVLLTLIGFLIFIFGLLADAISANRKINEELLYRIKKIEYNLAQKEEK